MGSIISAKLQTTNVSCSCIRKHDCERRVDITGAGALLDPCIWYREPDTVSIIMDRPSYTGRYQASNPIRIVTAASLFDGHDAAINIIRRVLQASGAEVIHLGHNRSVQEVVETAIQEDVQGIAVSSYQGGHMEYFRYMLEVLRVRNAPHIQVFGGGGGVIALDEVRKLHAYGMAHVFTSRDGMRLGLQGMINIMLKKCDFSVASQAVGTLFFDQLARRLSHVELQSLVAPVTSEDLTCSPVVGITGTGGAGKSTLTDEIVLRLLEDLPEVRVAVLSVDPTQKRTGGALLGDRIRMNALYGVKAERRAFMRSQATRQAHRATSQALRDSIAVCKEAGFDLVIVETAGVGQSDTEITDLADVSLYVMTRDYGAATQLEKIGMLDEADFVVLNKYDDRGSKDALRDIRKQVRRNRMAFGKPLEEMPVYPTMASRFHDSGVTALYIDLIGVLHDQYGFGHRTTLKKGRMETTNETIVPSNRQRYLGEIVETIRDYHAWVRTQVEYACKWGQAKGTYEQVRNWNPPDADMLCERLSTIQGYWWDHLESRCKDILTHWETRAEQYRHDTYTHEVRNRKITVPLYYRSLSGMKIPRVSLPSMRDPGERLKFALKENLPGYYPFTAGVYPFKRTTETPTRMFAGEGCSERTNRRFHILSESMPAQRLSTAFDSVTLYGFDPHERPDIYGKVGNAGVSVCTLDDMKKLYSGFNLNDPATSVSMTINGPAPMILAMFLNTAMDQAVEHYLRQQGRWSAAEEIIHGHLGSTRPEYVAYGPKGREEALPRGHDGTGLGLLGTSGKELVTWGVLTAEELGDVCQGTLRTVRGTVQADILKEDQAQNTCIFSTELALRMMGDIQEYFTEQHIRNFYSVSISGYHIAEAGANPITQLAFTLSNGFTYVEYYLSRGLGIDDFAPNLSFFFSNGMDPEYTVIGRVARRIWAVTMREKYGANERSQKLKYHIQTSGRSLHAQEITFNDIRTTLQALTAIYDNCNSLHTNAYDEALTTPTEESVRRAIAIQRIINEELGLAKNENPLQGAFIIETLTDLVEEAVLAEFERINDRGGVLGAMESVYQRSKIQEESMYYEQQKQSGTLPIIGVNMFVAQSELNQELSPRPLMRSSDEEKRHQIAGLSAFQARNADYVPAAQARLMQVARDGGNLFAEMMDTVRTCSLGQITDTLFRVGGRYRRNM